MDFTNTLVVGISSTALFDLSEEDEIFRTEGLEPFRQIQLSKEDDPLDPGTAFPLVRALLRLNREGQKPIVEVLLTSQNHPDLALRVFNSIEHHSLNITRAALTGGRPVAPYLEPFKVDLFLSTNESDVRTALRAQTASGVIYSKPEKLSDELDHVRIAFDGDCVLFSGESQRIYDRDGLDAFQENERRRALDPLAPGPFAKLLKTIARVQEASPDQALFRVALVTARNAPSHKRAIKTLESWGVRVDEAFFLGGIPKDGVLEKFAPHIFFDDQTDHCVPAAKRVSTARVPNVTDEDVTLRIEKSRGEFMLVCKKVLKRQFRTNESTLDKFYEQKVAKMTEESQRDFLTEFAVSAENTPAGEQRRSSAINDSNSAKLIAFLERLAEKHS